MENRIKESREELGMTQNELSEASGVARTIISQLENGTRDVITSITMIRLSRALQKPIDYLFLP